MLKKMSYIILILAILILLGIGGILVLRCLETPRVKTVASWNLQHVENQAVNIGDSFTVQTCFTTSLYYKDPDVFNAMIPESWVRVGTPKCQWMPTPTLDKKFCVQMTFRAVEPDTQSHALIPQVRIRGMGAVPDTTFALDTLYLPAVRMFSDLDTDALIVCGALPLDTSMSHRHFWFFGVLLAVLLVVIFVLIAFRKQNKVTSQRLVPPWITASEALQQLRADAAQSKISPERAVTLLSDIARNYLTARFGIPASSATTEEFFQMLARSQSPITHEHQQFLTDFMSAAEMIKFAGMHAEDQQVIHAINQAERLVRETQPKEDAHAE